jgi:uronate dehydrogenase
VDAAVPLGSANTRRFWDLAAGTELGYPPVDDAEAFAAEIRPETLRLQGGSYASPECTLPYL